jgi:hypothetical protein
MKILSIIVLLLISFSVQNDISGDGKDFLTGLLTVVKGEDFYEKTEEQELTFLGFELEQSVTLPTIVEDLFEGFLEGVSSVPVNQNKCLYGIDELKTNLKESIVNLFEGFRQNQVKKVVDASLKLLQIYEEDVFIPLSCKFDDLGEILPALTTDKGRAKFAWYVTSNFAEILKQLKRMDSGFDNKDYKKIGKAVGAIFKTAFKYSTK